MFSAYIENMNRQIAKETLRLKHPSGDRTDHRNGKETSGLARTGTSGEARPRPGPPPSRPAGERVSRPIEAAEKTVCSGENPQAPRAPNLILG